MHKERERKEKKKAVDNEWLATWSGICGRWDCLPQGLKNCSAALFYCWWVEGSKEIVKKGWLSSKLVRRSLIHDAGLFMCRFKRLFFILYLNNRFGSRTVEPSGARRRRALEPNRPLSAPLIFLIAYPVSSSFPFVFLIYLFIKISII